MDIIDNDKNVNRANGHSMNNSNTGQNSTSRIYKNDNDICNNSSSEIDTVYEKKLRVTCVERKYKVVDQKASFIIIAKKEFDEDTTEKMLHEDMELKTFLANYEIANIISQSPNNKNIDKAKEKNIDKAKEKNIDKAKEKNIDKAKEKNIDKAKEKNIDKAKEKKMPEIEKLETGKKEESESTRKRRDIIMATLKRRESFDSLGLPEEFLVKDYIEALEKNGMKISNSAMPYDDLKWLTKKGRVELVKKTDRGITVYRPIRNVETDKMG